MPTYEYFCSLHGKFEVLKGMEERESHPCPSCLSVCEKLPSLISSVRTSPFTKDGEGFSSVRYHPEEYKERVRYNAGKYD